MSEPTVEAVAEIKNAFLRHQVRLLSAALQPSSSWRETPNSESNEAPPGSSQQLSDRSIEAAMTRLNQKFKLHNSAVYSLAAQHHIAEQIEQLYFVDVKRVLRATGDVDADATVIDCDTDLTQPSTIAILPKVWDEVHLRDDVEHDSEDERRYAVLRSRLEKASKEREDQRRKLEQYRALAKLLEPYENAQENIQPNLVGRDAELSRELERMRVLLARVQGKAKLAGLGSRRNQDEKREERSQQDRLNSVMMEIT